jgi:hypothetical protein
MNKRGMTSKEMNYDVDISRNNDAPGALDWADVVSHA